MTKPLPRTGVIAFFVFVLLYDGHLYAQQTVSIGTTNTNANAVLWLEGNGQQGFIIPKTSNPANVPKVQGMMVYNTADSKVYYCDGTNWTPVSGGTATAQTLTLTGNTLSISGGNSVALAGTAPTGSGQLLMWNGTQWTPTSTTLPTTTGQVLKWNNTTKLWEPGTDNAGTATAIDNTTIDLNASTQLQVKDLGISTAKLQDAAVTDAKIATGISGSKVVPAFGTQAISTTGNLSAAAGTFSGNVNVRGLTYTWPSAQAAGVLTNNGSGVLSWAAAGLSNTLSAGNIWVGNASNVATPVTMSGDVTLNNSGAATIAANAVNAAKIADGSIGVADLSSMGATTGQMLQYSGSAWQPVSLSLMSSQTAATFLAAPASANGLPTFRAITATDIPALDAAKITSGTFPLTRITGAGASVRALLGSDNNTVSWISGSPSQLLGTDATGVMKFIDQSNFTFTNAGYIPRGSTTGLINSNFFDDGTNIGLGTTSPAYLLDVQKTLASSTDANLRVYSPSNTTGDKSGIRFGVGSFWAVHLQTALNGNWLELTNNAGTPYHSWTFDSYYPSSNGIGYLQGTTSGLSLMGGNVGIGTTAPTENLTISGGTGTSQSLTSYNGSAFLGASASSALSLKAGTSGGSVGWDIRASYGGLFIISSQITSGMLVFAKDNTYTAVLSNSHFGPYADVQLDLGTSSFRWNRLYHSGGVIGTSDRRLKTNIKPLTYGLKEVMQLSPVTYTWKKLPQQGTQLGLIAQEVREVLPEIIEEADDADKTLAMEHMELIPVLINAIKEQQQIITTLEARVKMLETREATELQKLQQDMAALQKMLQVSAKATKTEE